MINPITNGRSIARVHLALWLFLTLSYSCQHHPSKNNEIVRWNESKDSRVAQLREQLIEMNPTWGHPNNKESLDNYVNCMWDNLTEAMKPYLENDETPPKGFGEKCRINANAICQIHLLDYNEHDDTDFLQFYVLSGYETTLRNFFILMHNEQLRRNTFTTVIRKRDYYEKMRFESFTYLCRLDPNILIFQANPMDVPEHELWRIIDEEKELRDRDLATMKKYWNQ